MARGAGIAAGPAYQHDLVDVCRINSACFIVAVGVGAHTRQVKIKCRVRGYLVAAQTTPRNGKGLVDKRHDIG